MKIRFAFTLILTQLFLPLIGQYNYFRQYGPVDGLDNSFLYSINQDENGYLWVGTAEGLYRFNGFEFQHFTDQDSLAENFITTIYKDFSGGLWLGHMNGGITHISNNRFNKIIASSAFNSSITSITEADTGTIWFAIQNDGLLVLYPDNNIFEVSTRLDNEQISNIRHISGNYFLVGTQENLYIMEYQQESKSMVERVRILNYPYSKVAEIVKQKQGEYLIISHDAGIFRLSIDIDNISYDLTEISNNTNGNLDNSQGAIMLNSNEFWVNTIGNGIIKYHRDGESGEFLQSGYINDENGLISNNIQCLFEDREGNIWLGMYGDGLLRLVDDNLKFYSYVNTIGSNRIYSLSNDINYIWIASDNSLNKILTETGQVSKSYPLPDGLTGAKLNSIYRSEQGSIYLGFEKEGMFTFDPLNERFAKLFLSQDNLENSVNHITGKGNTIWISTKKGICKLNALTGVKRWFSTNDGLPHNNIQQLYIDSNDNVLIATICKNISYIDKNSKVTTFPNTNSMGLTSVISLVEDTSRSIWVATQGNGIYKFNGDTNLNFTRSSGLLSDYCYSMIFDGRHNIIVSHRGGFSQIDMETNMIKNYARYEGITSSADFYFNAILVDRLHNIWFGTSEGIIKYMPRLTAKGLTPPILHIDAVYVNKEKVVNLNTLDLNHGYYEIRVEYTGINFSNPELVKYQTFLEGYSADWSGVSTSRSVTYERVGYGEYNFRLRAFNENDIPAENPLTFSIRIKKPFYLTWWFILSSILILFTSVVTSIRIREQTLKREKNILEKKVRERTEEVVNKSLIIEEKNRNITDSIRYAERIQRAMLPKEDTFKETFVLFLPKDIVSGDFYWMHENAEVSFLAAVDCTGHGVPGAFMSFIGHNSLNKIVKDYGIKKPSEILDRLNVEVNKSIIQSQEIGIKDGMDIALIAFNRKDFTLEYAGAFNPLFVVRDGDLMIYKGDRYSICRTTLDENRSFTNIKVDIKPGDMLYLCSDGYADQFGSPEDKKFKTVNVKKILSEIWNLPVQEQKMKLEKEIMEWKGDLPQIDDIMFIGFRVTD